MKRLAVCAFLVLSLAACGGGGDESVASVPEQPPAQQPAAQVPAITAQPSAVTVTAPATAGFSVAADGSAPLAYQWRSSANGTDWAAIDGATGTSYTTGATDTGINGRWYSVVVSNSAGSVTSTAVQLTVNPPPPASGSGAFPKTPAPIALTPVAGGAWSRFGMAWRLPGLTGAAALSTDNASYALTIPVGSFPDTVDGTLTEIPAFTPQGGTELPYEKLVAAVSIAPGDLLTDRAMSLEIRVSTAQAATYDAHRLVAFAANADGSNFHLIPFQKGPYAAQLGLNRDFGISLMQTGIVGLATVSDAQLAALLQAWPQQVDDQLETALAGPVRQAWLAELGAAGLATNGRMQALAAASDNPLAAALTDYYDDVVVPAFADAYGNPEAIPGALAAGRLFLRETELRGLAEVAPFAANAADLQSRMSALLDRWADWAISECTTKKGLPQYQYALRVDRLLQLEGHADKAGAIEAALPSCSRFKVTYKDTWTNDRTGAQTFGASSNLKTESYQGKIAGTVYGEVTVSVGQTADPAPLRLQSYDDTFVVTMNGRCGSPDGASSYDCTAVRTTTTTALPDASQLSATVAISALPNRSGAAAIGLNATQVIVQALTYRSSSSWMTAVPLRVHAEPALSVSGGGTPWFDTGGIYAGDGDMVLEMHVPALPALGDFKFGPMLVGASGTATSRWQETKNDSFSGGTTSQTQTQEVTVSVSAAN